MKALKPPFEITYETVTPEQAKDYLKVNTSNRHLRQSLIEAFTRDMRTGKWVPNHQGIAFGRDGKLLDGQHRLTSVVQAGVSLPFLIFRNVPTVQAETKTMHTIDRGAARSLADMLNLEENVFEANLVAAICTALATMVVQNGERIRRVTMPQVMEILGAWKDDISYVVKNRTNKHLLRSAIVLAAVALARATDEQRAAVDEFFRQYNSGIGLKSGAAALALREYVLGQKYPPRSRSERFRFGNIALFAICRHIEGGAVGRLSYTDTGAQFFLAKQKETAERIAAIFPAVSRSDREKKSVRAARAVAVPAPAVVVATKLPPEYKSRRDMIAAIARKHS